MMFSKSGSSRQPALEQAEHFMYHRVSNSMGTPSISGRGAQDRVRGRQWGGGCCLLLANSASGGGGGGAVHFGPIQPGGGGGGGGGGAHAPSNTEFLTFIRSGGVHE